MNDSQSNMPGKDEKPDWKSHGLRIIRGGELDSKTPQTPGMTRAEAISRASAGAQKLWAGTVVVQPNAKTGPHHHGELETVIYVVPVSYTHLLLFKIKCSSVSFLPPVRESR